MILEAASCILKRIFKIKLPFGFHLNIYYGLTDGSELVYSSQELFEDRVCRERRSYSKAN